MKVSACAFLPESKGLLVKCPDRLKVLDIKSGKVVRKFVQDSKPINELAISTDGKLALTAGGQNVDMEGHVGQGSGLTLWDVTAGKPLRRLETGDFRHVTFSGDAKLAMAESSATVRIAIELWDIPRRKLLFTLDRSDGWGAPITFSPDSKFAIVGQWEEGSDNNGLVFLEPAKGKEV
jgi:WD40 repeat protein